MALAVEYDEQGNPKPQTGGADPNPFGNNTGIAGPAPAPVNAAPAGGFDAEKFRKGWAYGGAGFGTQTNIGELQKFIADNPAFASGVTLKGEKVYDPSGRFMFDAIGNYTGGDPKGMTRIALQGNSSYQKGTPGKGGKPGKASTGIPPAGGAGGGGAAGAPRSGVPGGFNTGGLGNESKGIFDLLMERARGSENVDPNDPIIKAQTDAFRAEGTQARRDFLAREAEAGGPYGNMRSENRRSAEELGKSVGGFQAQAMQQELSARRAKIQHALDGAAGFLTDQQRMALQNELTRLQLAQQESQFGRNLAWDKSRFGQQLGWEKESFGRTLGQRAHEYDTSRWDSIFG